MDRSAQDGNRVSGGGRIQTLLVDDAPVITDLLRSFLGDTGRFDIVGVAVDGLDAISKSETLHPELIVMDIEMPAFNGLRAAKIIKSKPDAPRVVLLSLHAGKEYRKAADKAKTDGFCDKLCLEKDLLDIIRGIFPDRFD